MAEPGRLVEEIERRPELPGGTEERFAGYGVMGLPFASGHVLGLRRFPASSVGPGYTSVWYRDAGGRWTFYQNVEPRQSCPRFFGSAIAEAPTTPIEVTWMGPREFSVTIGDGVLSWDLSLVGTATTRMMNAVGRLMPDALWRRPAVLRAMSAVASATLGAGRLGLVGRAPNGQSFIANPLLMWFVSRSDATVNGVDLGAPGALAEQAHLGDFWIPQRGVFVIGRALFEPFDATRHASATAQAS